MSVIEQIQLTETRFKFDSSSYLDILFSNFNHIHEEYLSIKKDFLPNIRQQIKKQIKKSENQMSQVIHKLISRQNLINKKLKEQIFLIQQENQNLKKQKQIMKQNKKQIQQQFCLLKQKNNCFQIENKDILKKYIELQYETNKLKEYFYKLKNKNNFMQQQQQQLFSKQDQSYNYEQQQIICNKLLDIIQQQQNQSSYSKLQTIKLNKFGDINFQDDDFNLKIKNKSSIITQNHSMLELNSNQKNNYSKDFQISENFTPQFSNQESNYKRNSQFTYPTDINNQISSNTKLNQCDYRDALKFLKNYHEKNGNLNEIVTPKNMKVCNKSNEQQSLYINDENIKLETIHSIKTKSKLNIFLKCKKSRKNKENEPNTQSQKKMIPYPNLSMLVKIPIIQKKLKEFLSCPPKVLNQIIWELWYEQQNFKFRGSAKKYGQSMLPQGYGQLINMNGQQIYYGSWRKGLFDGWGHLKINKFLEDTEIESINGYFLQGQLNGTATISLINGSKYMGMITNGIIQGQGTFIDNNENKIKGYWSKNKLILLLGQ